MLKKIRNTKLGFTLIELLVVISIIGVLSSVILASVKNARNKSKNAKFVSELKSLQNAMALYINQYGQLPTNSYATDYNGSNQLSTALNPLITNKFIPKIPNHPDWPRNSTPWSNPKLTYIEFRAGSTGPYTSSYGCGLSIYGNVTGNPITKSGQTGSVLSIYTRDPDLFNLKMNTINTNCYTYGNGNSYCWSPDYSSGTMRRYCIPF